MFTNHKIKFDGMGNLRNLKIDNDRGINTEVKVLYINLDKRLDHAVLLKVEDVTSKLKKLLESGEPATRLIHLHEQDLAKSESKTAQQIYLGGMIEQCDVFFNIPIKTKTIYLSFITQFNAEDMLKFQSDKDWFGEYFNSKVVRGSPKGLSEPMRMARKFVPSYFYKGVE